MPKMKRMKNQKWHYKQNSDMTHSMELSICTLNAKSLLEKKVIYTCIYVFFYRNTDMVEA